MKLIFVGLFLIFLSVLTAVSCSAAEADYIEKYCTSWKGEAEVILSDRTRADCITAKYAIEFEFADKWKEPITQALHYSILTGKRAKIFLICKQDGDEKYVYRIKRLILFYDLPIELDTLGCSANEN